jgi:hypothetical protein
MPSNRPWVIKSKGSNHLKPLHPIMLPACTSIHNKIITHILVLCSLNIDIWLQVKNVGVKTFKN